MLKEKILPADTFTVINKSILTNYDKKILIMLYQPIIGSISINLYLSLWSYLDKMDFMSIEYNHHNLINNMGVSLEDIISSREKLEALGLVRSYIKKDRINSLIYELYSPLSPNEFFKNPLLSVSLYSTIGKIEYERLKEYFRLPKINISEYADISCNFNDIFDVIDINSYENTSYDLKKVNVNKLSVISKINIDNTLSLVPEEILNIRSVTKDMKDLIYNLSLIYNLDDYHMSDLISSSVNSKKTIDKKLLRDNARKYYLFEHNGKLPSIALKSQPEYLRRNSELLSLKEKTIRQFETITPYDFLLSKHGGEKLTKNEISILEYLLVDMKLTPGVTNVLIDYVLRINDNKLIKNFVEVIAEQWSRKKIKTVSDAMELALKENKASKKIKEKKTKKIESKPEWFNQNIKAEKATEEEQEEINKLLSEYEV